MTAISNALNCLQVGAGWFPEQAGGLNRFYYDLLHHLPSAGVHCRGLVAGRSTLWPANGAVKIGAFAPLDSPLPKRWLAERRAVARALADESFDLVVAHFALYAFPILDIVRSKRPMVVHFQGPWAEESRREGAAWLGCAIKAKIERMVYQRADRVIVLSTAFKQILIDQYGVAADRIRVVPGGVDCARFDIPESQSEARVKLGWPTGRPTVLAVRRLTQRMGLENLIEAAAKVRESVPDVLVLIAGGGALRPRLEQLIREHGLGNTVKLLGFVPDADLPLAYRAADYTVVPTVALEGFGLVAAESLAAGTPAMATPVDGLVDLLGPFAEAALFRGPNIADIADGLTAVLTGCSSLPSSTDCVNYARRRFDWAVIATAVTDVYRDAIQDKRATYGQA